MPMGFRATSATTEDVSTVTRSCAEAVAPTPTPHTSATTTERGFFTGAPEMERGWPAYRVEGGRLIPVGAARRSRGGDPLSCGAPDDRMVEAVVAREPAAGTRT